MYDSCRKLLSFRRNVLKYFFRFLGNSFCRCGTNILYFFSLILNSILMDWEGGEGKRVSRFDNTIKEKVFIWRPQFGDPKERRYFKAFNFIRQFCGRKFKSISQIYQKLSIPEQIAKHLTKSWTMSHKWVSFSLGLYCKEFLSWKIAFP